MHWGQGIALGLGGVMAEGGLRGSWASAMFTVVRLTADQTQENITAVGAPPWTWPRSELLIDLFHKAIYGSRPGWSLTGWRSQNRCGSRPAATAPTPSTIGEGSVRARRAQQRPVSAPGGQVS